jgi:hypothetical protein
MSTCCMSTVTSYSCLSERCIPVNLVPGFKNEDVVLGRNRVIGNGSPRSIVDCDCGKVAHLVGSGDDTGSGRLVGRCSESADVPSSTLLTGVGVSLGGSSMSVCVGLAELSDSIDSESAISGRMGSRLSGIAMSKLEVEIGGQDEWAAMSSPAALGPGISC